MKKTISLLLSLLLVCVTAARLICPVFAEEEAPVEDETPVVEPVYGDEGEAPVEDETPIVSAVYGNTSEGDSSIGNTGSVISEGSLWIVIGITVMVFAGCGVLVISKKKK